MLGDKGHESGALGGRDLSRTYTHTTGKSGGERGADKRRCKSRHNNCYLAVIFHPVITPLAPPSPVPPGTPTLELFMGGCFALILHLPVPALAKVNTPTLTDACLFTNSSRKLSRRRFVKSTSTSFIWKTLLIHSLKTALRAPLIPSRCQRRG
ncbi:hypothetical protein J6590_002205 [Homalodisca vitripennis]|nr:hypothetical protein J6590_002205 [Homalodisca vitripennis]